MGSRSPRPKEILRLAVSLWRLPRWFFLPAMDLAIFRLVAGVWVLCEWASAIFFLCAAVMVYSRNVSMGVSTL